MSGPWIAARAFAGSLALLTVSGVAGAQPRGEAEDLFRRGRALYDEGKLAEACDALGRSEALDPGVGTLGLLAACEEKRGLLARAHADFVETARLAHAAGDKREAYAAERAAALAPRVPHLVIRVDAARPPIRVTRAGQVVPADRLGTDLLVDPGPFEVVATAADGREFRSALVAAPGQRLEVVIPAFATQDAPVAHPVEHPVARALAWVTGGLGLVGVGVGAGLGVHAISENNSSMTCAPAPTCPARDAAYAAANGSTAAFAVGVAALGASAVLFVVSRPSASPVAVTIAPSVAGRGGTGGTVSMTGTF